jgi:hypothetical protein
MAYKVTAYPLMHSNRRGDIQTSMQMVMTDYHNKIIEKSHLVLEIKPLIACSPLSLSEVLISGPHKILVLRKMNDKNTVDWNVWEFTSADKAREFVHQATEHLMCVSQNAINADHLAGNQFCVTKETILRNSDSIEKM